MGANERFEYLAEQFRSQTGVWPPGKSMPLGMEPLYTDEERMAMWDKWLAARPKRPSIDDYLMGLARQAATRHTCPRKAVGVVFSRQGRVLMTAYNGAPPGQNHCDQVGCILVCRILVDGTTAITAVRDSAYVDESDLDVACVRASHAERNGIATAARFGVVLEGSELHTTVKPCLDCAKDVLSAGVKRVVYEADCSDKEGERLLGSAGVELCRLA